MTKDNILKALKNAGYAGAEDAASVKKYVEDNNISLVDADGKSVDIDAKFKAVLIKVETTEGEQVMCNDEPLEMAEPMEVAEDGYGMDDKPKASPKTASLKETNNKGVHMFNIGNDKEAFARKNYNRLAAKGESFFADADEAEAAGAFFRYKVLNNVDGYAQKKRDLEIINKTWSTSTGGLVPTFIETYIQENLNKYGVARKVVGDKLHRMRSLTLNLNDLTSDAVVTIPSQGTAGDANASTPAVALKTLTAVKAIGTKQITAELLNDSPVNIADYIARSFTRAIAKVEDLSYIGDPAGSPTYTTGILHQVAAGSILTNGLNKTWTSVTDAEITNLMSKLSIDYNHAEAAFVCSRNYYFSTLYRLQKAAGGVSLNEAMNGVKSLFPNADASYFGVPVYFSECFSAVSGTQGSGVANRPILYGCFGDAMAMGYVEGSMEIASSSEFAFDKDVLTVRAKERFAVTPVNLGTASVAGGIVAGGQNA